MNFCPIFLSSFVLLSYLAQGQTITGPRNMCPNGSAIYRIHPAPGAASYKWDAPPGCTINGEPPPTTTTQPSVTITFGNIGGVISVQSSNTNDSIVGTVQVTPIPPTRLPPKLVCDSVDIPINATYQTTLLTAVGCDSTIIQKVEMQPKPVVQIKGRTKLTCAQPVASLAAETNMANLSLLWTGPSGWTGRGSPIQVSEPGTYTLQAIDSLSGCNTTAIYTLTRDTQPPTVQATGGSQSCNPEMFRLGAMANITNARFKWSGPNGFMATVYNPIAKEPGLYQVTATNPANGCTATATATVLPNSNAPTAVVSAKALGDGRHQLQCATNAAAAAFRWTGPNYFASTQQNPIIVQTGVYTVRVTDLVSGCLSYRTISVAIGEQTPPTTSGWVLAPNPASEVATLQFMGQRPPALTQVQVLDATGRMCWEGQTADGSPLVIHVGAFSPGVYRVVLQGEAGRDVKMLVKL